MAGNHDQGTGLRLNLIETVMPPIPPELRSYPHFWGTPRLPIAAARGDRMVNYAMRRFQSRAILTLGDTGAEF